MTRVLPAAAAVAAALAALAPAPAGAVSCAPRAALVQTLDRDYGERPVAVGLAGPGLMVEVFASAAGTFTVLASRPDGLACVLAAGDEWRPMPPASAPGRGA